MHPTPFVVKHGSLGQGCAHFVLVEIEAPVRNVFVNEGVVEILRIGRIHERLDDRLAIDQRKPVHIAVFERLDRQRRLQWRGHQAEADRAGFV